MTTITLSSFCVFAVVAFAIIELFLWGIEFVFPTVQKLVCYFMKKPCSWKDGYLEARITITMVLQKISWAEMSPKDLVKYRELLNKKRDFKQDLTEFRKWKKKQLAKRLDKKQKHLNQKKARLNKK